MTNITTVSYIHSYLLYPFIPAKYKLLLGQLAGTTHVEDAEQLLHLVSLHPDVDYHFVLQWFAIRFFNFIIKKNFIKTSKTVNQLYCISHENTVNTRKGEMYKQAGQR